MDPSFIDEVNAADVTNDSVVAASPETTPRANDDDDDADDDEYEEDGDADYSWPSDEFQSDEDDFPTEVEENDSR